MQSFVEWTKSTPTTKHTCGGPHFGKRAPQGECPRCDELHAGKPPIVQNWRGSKARNDKMRSDDIKNHNCKKSGCGPVCTHGDW